ncbi:MAG TPA: hypothetical protein VGI67_09945 [Thermoleophilaceae bacterium]|jgi:hypothetical protein
MDRVYRRRHMLRLLGLSLLVSGLGVATGFDSVVGLALIGVAAIVLALVQPQLLAHVQSRQARRRAPDNGHGTIDRDDVDLDSL